MWLTLSGVLGVYEKSMPSAYLTFSSKPSTPQVLGFRVVLLGSYLSVSGAFIGPYVMIGAMLGKPSKETNLGKSLRALIDQPPKPMNHFKP